MPELLFRPTYDALHRVREITVDVQRIRLIQQGYREPMLCSDCEAKFGRWEKYFADVWFNIPRRPTTVTGAITTIKGLDYHQFKLFHLSLLWRAGVSEQVQFAQVRLGPHEERLRQMLLAEDPGPPDAYPFWAEFLVHPKTGHTYDDVIIEPTSSRPSGHTVYIFVFGGCAWYYFASSHTGDWPLPTKLDYSGELIMHATSIFDFRPLVDSFVGFHTGQRSDR